MAESDIIQEYLVSLGFQIDANGMARFGRTLGTIGKVVAGVAATMITAATATVAYVEKISNTLEDLYYASQVLNSSADQIQSYGLAISNLGGTAEGARGSLMGLASAMRNNPGIVGLIGSLGVKTQGRSDVQIMEDLGQVFKRMPFFIANQYARMLGIDENTLLAMERGKPGDFNNPYGAMYKAAGIDINQATKQGHDFLVQMRGLGAIMGVFAIEIGTKVLPVAQQLVYATGNAIRWIEAWASSKEAMNLGGSLVNLFRAANALGGTLWGLTNQILGFFHSSPFKLLQSAIALLTNFVNGLADIASATSLALHGKWKEAWDILTGKSKQSAVHHELESGGGINGPGPVDNNGNVKRNNPGNLRSWGNTPTQGGFAVFNSDLQGISAAAGNLLAYGLHQWNTVSQIIGHWAPPGDRNDTAAYIKDVASRLHLGVNQALNLNDPATLAGLLGAIFHHEQGRDPYSSQMIMAGVGNRLAMMHRPLGGGGNGTSVTVHQHNDTTIHGSSDPHEMARQQRNLNRRSNADLQKLMPSAVR